MEEYTVHAYYVGDFFPVAVTVSDDDEKIILSMGDYLNADSKHLLIEKSVNWRCVFKEFEKYIIFCRENRK